ncbi:MAG: Rrf2 family transcriptional regulator [Pirellulales bacterium]|nr:Rrf2 family transcriptional regulator [Pirellulales bacterium]
MKVSAKVEYACVAMLELAASYGSKRPVRIRHIAEQHGVPSRFLVQILLQLKEAGLVSSIRGAAGGYMLVANPKDVSLGQVMSIIEGSSEDQWQKTANSSADSPMVRVLMRKWSEIGSLERKMLHETKLADLVGQAAEESAQAPKGY